MARIGLRLELLNHSIRIASLFLEFIISNEDVSIINVPLICR